MKNNSALRYLSHTAGRTKAGIGGLLLVQIFQGVCSVCYALFLRDIINCAVAGNKNGFRIAIIRFALLFAAQLALSALRRWLNVAVESRLENRFKSQVFRALLKGDYGVVNAVHSGELMSRLTSDTVVVAGGMTEILPGIAGMAVKLVGAVIMIIALEPRFLYLIVPGGAALLIFSTMFRRNMKRLHKQIQEKDGKLRVFLQETLGSLPVVRSYAVEDQTIAQADGKMEEHREAKLRRSRLSNAANVGFGFAMQGAYVFGAIFCGYGILTGTMDYGSFTAVLNLIGQIQNPFANISGFLPKYYAMIASAERLIETERMAASKPSEALPTEAVLEAYASDIEGFGLENAEFHYLARSGGYSGPPEKDPLSPLPANTSFYIKKGGYAAFTGPSGSGKSTAMQLLMCLYSLDGGERYIIRNGVREPLDGKWQRLFAYVPQGNYLMSGTIREIVSYADPDAMKDEERLQKALTVACAEFVYGLENGPDTVLGERGAGLSEGQMQRIAIARALFSNRPVLMLDECTSALDEATEKKLLTNLREMTDKTVLIITHKKASLEICDSRINFERDVMDRKV